jgi:hypothetical protein
MQVENITATPTTETLNEEKKHFPLNQPIKIVRLNSHYWFIYSGSLLGKQLF